MKSITPNQLIEYVKDYDYEIDRQQAIEIMEILDDNSLDGSFNSIDIEQATDYVVNRNKSIYADYFE